MNIIEFSVRRPVTITMIYLAIVCAGLGVIAVIPQELFPSVTFPQLTIVTPYANAAPEEIENLVTKLVEESIATVKNIKTIRSFSREGVSMVIAEFNWGTDMNFASLNLREKIDLVKERLPREAEEPLVLKFNPFSKPIMVYSLTARGDPQNPATLKMSDLLKIAKERIKDKLEKVPGIASVAISGGEEREIHVDLNLDQLLSHKINLLDVEPALKNSNLNYPAGSVKEEFFEYLVRTMGEYQDLNDIETTLVSIENIKKGKYDRRRQKEESKAAFRPDEKSVQDHSSQFVLVKDIAKVTDGFKDVSSFSRYQGKNNISLSIQNQASANIIKCVKDAKKELYRLQTETNVIPKGVDLTLVYDQSEFIKISINGVVKSAMMGGILAFFVLYFFLRNFKSSLIVSASIPVSVLAAFIAMYFFDITVNMMSLGGLALGIGMLVDNAIVVVENIERHKSMGKNLDNSAIEGGQEVFASIFSSTLTTVAVFLPLAFVYGISGELFKPISFTIVFSLSASLIVAITLIPRLSIIKFGKGGMATESGPFMQMIEKTFAKLLSLFLKVPKTGLIAAAALFVASFLLMTTFETEVMPKVDQGQFNVKLSLPTGTVLNKTNQALEVLEKELLTYPDIESVSIAVGSDKGGKASLNSLGSHQGQIMVKLKKIREKHTYEIIRDLQDAVEEKKATLDLPPLKMAEIIYTPEDNPFAGAFDSSAPINVNVTGRDLEKLQEMVIDVENLLKSVEGVHNVRNDIPSKSPEYRILPNRKRAAINGISASDIAQTALIAVRGMVATKLKKDGRETDILVRVQKKENESVGTLGNIPIFVEDKIIPLKDVAKVIHGQGPSEIKRLDQTRIFHVFGDIRDRSEAEVLKEIEKKLKTEIVLPENYFVGYGQEYEDKKKSSMSMMVVFGLSIILVYMIMAAQFESLWQPFIIMMTVPLSVIGVSASLFMTGISLNAMSMLGLIMLGGIVVNNGIVLIQFINDLRAEGIPLKEAIISGTQTRLRPILMTTMTTLLGLIPLATKMEEGSEFQQPMAVSVIGGLLVSTCLTLFIVPALYLVSENVFLFFKKKKLLA